MSKSAPCFALCSKAFWLVWQEQKTVLSVFTTSRGAVNGGVHWFVNKTADGRLLVMFNNSGIERSVEKGEYVFRQGEHINDIAVTLEGRLHVQKDDYWGNRSILAEITVGELFGEAYVSPEGSTLINDVVAIEDSAVIFFDVRRVITTCPSACRFHSIVVQNMFLQLQKKQKAVAIKALFDIYFFPLIIYRKF